MSTQNSNNLNEIRKNTSTVRITDYRLILCLSEISNSYCRTRLISLFASAAGSRVWSWCVGFLVRTAQSKLKFSESTDNEIVVAFAQMYTHLFAKLFFSLPFFSSSLFSFHPPLSFLWSNDGTILFVLTTCVCVCGRRSNVFGGRCGAHCAVSRARVTPTYLSFPIEQLHAFI